MPRRPEDRIRYMATRPISQPRRIRSVRCLQRASCFAIRTLTPAHGSSTGAYWWETYQQNDLTSQYSTEACTSPPGTANVEGLCTMIGTETDDRIQLNLALQV